MGERGKVGLNVNTRLLFGHDFQIFGESYIYMS